MAGRTDVIVLCGIATLAVAGGAAAQGPSPWARVSFFTQAGRASLADGPETTFAEFVTTATVQSPLTDSSGFGYGVDIRLAGYPLSDGRESRTSVYEAFVAKRVTDRLDVRAGQLWINELGALGSVGDAAVLLHAVGEVGESVQQVHNVVRGSSGTLLTNVASVVAGFKAATHVMRERYRKEGEPHNGG